MFTFWLTHTHTQLLSFLDQHGQKWQQASKLPPLNDVETLHGRGCPCGLHQQPPRTGGPSLGSTEHLPCLLPLTQELLPGGFALSEANGSPLLAVSAVHRRRPPDASSFPTDRGARVQKLLPGWVQAGRKRDHVLHNGDWPFLLQRLNSPQASL